MPAAAEPSALLYVHMNPPPGAEDAFNTWYDQHAPARLALPGVLSARRYWAVSPNGPRHMACYDLGDVSALHSPEYLRLRAAEKERDREFMGRITLVDRRVYRALDLGKPWTAPWTEHARYVVSMTMDPPPELVEDYHAWYLEEHIPMLMQVPGWRRIRRFEQLDARSTFLALHEVESLDVFGTDAFKAAVGTPWRDRVLGYVTRRERLTFELARGFERSG
jgi:hypothetical protein